MSLDRHHQDKAPKERNRHRAQAVSDVVTALVEGRDCQRELRSAQSKESVAGSNDQIHILI